MHPAQLEVNFLHFEYIIVRMLTANDPGTLKSTDQLQGISTSMPLCKTIISNLLKISDRVVDGVEEKSLR